MSDQPIDLAPVKDHYGALLRKHGISPKSLSWKDESVALRNFAAVTQLFAHEHSPFSVYEVGCGLGHLSDFLEQHFEQASYSGCDILEDMIRKGIERKPGLPLEVRNILENPPPVVDYVVVSGLFNLRLQHSPEVWWEFVKNMLHVMYGSARKGIASNFLTSVVDWKRDWGYYQDPSQVFKYSQDVLSRFVEIRHAYYPWEFTLCVYREPIALPYGPPPVSWPPETRERIDDRRF